MKQRFTNSYCFGDHNAIKVFAVSTFDSFIEKEVLKKFQNISPNGIAFINQGETTAILHDYTRNYKL